MARDSDEILVALTGDVYVAPVGTALPTTEVVALNGAFSNLGYLTEDGVAFAVGQEVEEIPAWQSLDPVRRLLTAREFTSGFSLLQWNEHTFQVAFNGGAVTEPTSGHYKYTFPTAADGIAEFAVVLDLVDGAKKYRVVMPRVTNNEGAELNLVKTGPGSLPVSLKALTPETGDIVAIYTNDPAFEASS